MNAKSRISSLMGSAAGGVLFLVLALIAIRGFLGLFPPKPYEPPGDMFADYDTGPMQTAVSPGAVRKELDRIADLGNRYLGSDGFYRCEELIRQRYNDAGLEIFEHSLRIAAPLTEFAEVLTEDGRRSPFNVYPYIPNHYQPVSTPDEGITGILLKVDDEVLRNRQTFTGCFALIDASVPTPKGYGYDYLKYAQLGFAGIVVSHPDGLASIKWASLAKMASANSINYLRVVADPEVFEYVDKRVTLRVRVRFRNVPNRTLLGVLKSDRDVSEALIIPCSYDAWSVLPDKSPGLVQALPVAIQLKLLDGLKQYQKDLRRDVIFVAFGGSVMGHDAQNLFLQATGNSANRNERRVFLETSQRDNSSLMAAVTAILTCFDDGEFMASPDSTEAKLASLADPARELFDEQCQYTLNSLIFELSESLLQNKIEYDKVATVDPAGTAYKAYRTAKQIYDKAFSCAGYPVIKMLRRQADFVSQYEVRQLVLDRISELDQFHRERALFLDQGLVLNKLLSGYSAIVVLAPELATAEEKPVKELLSFTLGTARSHADYGQPPKDVISAAIRRLNMSDTVQLYYGAPKKHGADVNGKLSAMPVAAQVWSNGGVPAFSLVNMDRSYVAYADPVEMPHMRNTESLKGSLSVVGETILSVAHGNGTFIVPKMKTILNFRGNVFVSNVGQSMIPNYPLKGALLGTKMMGEKTIRAYFGALMFFADPYGHYDRSYCTAMFQWATWDTTIEAVGYGANGVINLISDQGVMAQKIYQSMRLRPVNLANDVNVVCFRGDPVTILDLINPQSLKSYTGVEFIRKRGLDGFANTWTDSRSGVFTTFVKPDQYFYVKLKAGDVDNELVQTTRAFLLGEPPPRTADDGAQAEARAGSEIKGSGYLAAETPFIIDVPFRMAASMNFVNDQRLRVQNRYAMADKRTQTFQLKATEMLESASSPGIAKKQSVLDARDAVTYATLNHPVLRRNIFEAVAGILWYLGLLVPFVFFFEKLLFGFSDIRKQLAVHSITFIVVFILLRILHPAFAMIRSSLMILLGFVILLIALGIILLFSSKFRENMEGMRKKRGKITAAEVNTFGAIATAFMLGLNNMHRRRIRTLLTCGTLVLLTFVMICFTSVQSDLVETTIALGKAPFTGFVVKNEEYRPVSEAEVFALQSKYGDSCTVVSRRVIAGVEHWNTREREYPQIEIVRRIDDLVRSATPHSVLSLAPLEPLARGLDINGRWYSEEEAADPDATIPILVSESIARELDIAPDAFRDGKDVAVMIAGVEYIVCGTFKGESLDNLYDLDGRNLLPFDIKALREVRKEKASGHVIAGDEDPQVPGKDVIIAPKALSIINVGGSARVLSVAIILPDDFTYKQAKAEIDRHMEQSGRTTYYGLDGYAFVGRSARESSLVGLVDMLIPLLIAAITVLNTIRGSVYERKDEIFVYNAVGIAPNHVFFIFFAEAFVYAVVGSVTGYLLSQGTGRLLTVMNLTGGLNMTFTSLGTIYASLTIAFAVFVSTWFPARTAMKIAAPTEDVGWRLPEPEGGKLSFKLPFTFDWHDRVAVLEFFRRYFEDNGEGSSGLFFAGVPHLGLAEQTDPLNDNGYVPQIAVQIWLKPFDLGISQQLIITMPTDEETKEFVAQITLTRVSGTLQNWKRLNRVFVGLVRKHFLHWRAVSPDERAEMHQAATDELRRELGLNNQ